jgi:hypothetical protein
MVLEHATNDTYPLHVRDDISLGMIWYSVTGRKKLRTQLQKRAGSALQMTKEQTMSAMFTKPALAISLLASLVATSTTANAGATISDKRYWPSEVGPSAYGAVSTQHAPRDAFAAISRTASPAVASAPAEQDTWHYVDGPKSSIAPSRGF